MNTRTAYRQQNRLRAIIKMFVGCKWSESGPLAELRPEDEKYITEKALLVGLDKFIKERTDFQPAPEHNWQTCKDIDCEECQELVDHGIIEACDSCGSPGQSEAGPGSWYLLKTGELLCRHCFDKQGLTDKDCQ